MQILLKFTFDDRTLEKYYLGKLEELLMWFYDIHFSLKGNINPGKLHCRISQEARNYDKTNILLPSLIFNILSL